MSSRGPCRPLENTVMVAVWQNIFIAVIEEEWCDVLMSCDRLMFCAGGRCTIESFDTVLVVLWCRLWGYLLLPWLLCSRITICLPRGHVPLVLCSAVLYPWISCLDRHYTMELIERVFGPNFGQAHSRSWQAFPKSLRGSKVRLKGQCIGCTLELTERILDFCVQAVSMSSALFDMSRLSKRRYS